MTQTVYEKLVATTRRFPNHDLFAMPSWLQQRWSLPQRSWTYAETLHHVDELAGRYRDAGYGAGHRVALLLENRPDHFFHWLALNSLGASVVPLNPDYREEEARYVLEHSESLLVVAAEAVRERIAPVADACRIPLTVVAASGEAPPPPRARSTPPGALAGEDAECALLYTSGTTGKPKACMLSNGHFFGWGEWYEAQQGYISLRAGKERLLQPLPTFHVNGMGNAFMGMLFTGGAQILLDRFHPRSWWADAIETGATCFHYLGVMPAMLMNLPPAPDDKAHAMRFGMGGGVYPLHHAAFEARFGVPLVEGWAMTEVGGGGIMCAMEEPRHVGEACIGTPDRAGPPVEIRIVGDDGNEVPRGESGELQLRARGENPRRRFFSGYFKDDAATAAVWRGGWFHTGDILRQDAQGRVFFVDRLKNIIRRSGENIAGAEVEAALLAHPAVGQAAVLAVLDEIRGEEVMAVIAPRSGEAAGLALAESIVDHCLARLAYYKAPGYVAFRDELPTTSTQKVRMNALGDLARRPAEQPDCHDLRERKQRARTDRAPRA
jgi:acyl-CoA synthetase (AMP-forming)/AMP-acid ligase II